MLEELHVRNFALIERADVELGKGLNILTGETGAGKSILIDAMNVVLGGKCGPGMIRHGAEQAYVELVFHMEENSVLSLLRTEYDVEAEDGTLILSRKILSNRSIFKVNDTTVTAAKVRELTAHLIDIHGQHEHQSLLYKSKHLEILDSYAGDGLAKVKLLLKDAYQEYKKAKDELEAFTMSEEERLRELDFLQYEVNEIEAANLRPGEEEELEILWKKIDNSRDIMEALESAHHLIGYQDNSSAGNAVSSALSEIQHAVRYDEALQSMADQLQDIEALLSDLNREIASYMDDMTFDEETFHEVSTRLDLIRNLESKYGRDYDEIMKQLIKRQERIALLDAYDLNHQNAIANCEACKAKVLSLCKEASVLRRNAASPLIAAITNSLKELNFLQVDFDIALKQLEHFGSNGYDESEFMLSTNPGQPLQPLSEIASGGELSRIMLAVKTVLADSDEIPTLIFDEIDTGISGKTAACVSEKLSVIGKNHQVICITHLPQIAAKADQHFLIEKGIEGSATRTIIQPLDEEKSVEELARLLGGAEITEAALENARSLKNK